MFFLKKAIFKALYYILLIIAISCASNKHVIIPTFNKGGYIINSNKKKLDLNSTDIYIYGRVLDVINKKPISNVQISMGCSKTQTSLNGEYSFKVKRSEDIALNLKSITIGYKSVETEFFDFSKTSDINVDLFLIEDDTPFINCEGKN